MQICKFITLSTAHIRPATADLLDMCAQTESNATLGEGIVIYAKQDYGWFLFICVNELATCVKQGNTDIPEDLLACLQVAVKADCAMLCLDRDGEEVRELPTYEAEWEHSQFENMVQPVLEGITKSTESRDTKQTAHHFVELARKYGFSICEKNPARQNIQFQEGVCPVCGKASLNYLDASPDFVYWECTECHATGAEGCDYDDDGYSGVNKVFDGFHYDVKEVSGNCVKFCCDCFSSEGGRRCCVCADDPVALTLLAKNTDGTEIAWIEYDHKKDTVHIFGNTDHLNIWLCDTRPDMTPEKCVQFVRDLNDVLGLTGNHCIGIHELIDPEDWQELAHVPDAYEDGRYTVY